MATRTHCRKRCLSQRDRGTNMQLIEFVEVFNPRVFKPRLTNNTGVVNKESDVAPLDHRGGKPCSGLARA